MSGKNFHTVRVPKGNGQYREIYVPSESFKAELKSYLPLLTEISSKTDDINVCHAFMKGRNCVTNAVHHIGYRYTLSFDIKDFFNSIRRRHLDGKVPELLLRRCLVDQSPKQGLPTSPLLSNIALSGFDRDLKSSLTLLTNKYSYTRYADDLTISFDDDKAIHKISFTVENLLSRYGFELSKNKSKLQMSSNGRVIVTGVGVDKCGVHPTRATRKKIRAAIHQGNWKAVAGLKEWEKCKLPVSERRMEKLPNAYTPLSLKQTSCSLCGEGQLVWGKSIHEKIRLINVYSKSPHRCAQSGNFLSQEELADALIDIGYKIVPMASRTWSAGLVFSKANEAHFVLFRTHGVDSSFRFEDCFSYDDDGKVRLSGYFRRIKRKDYSDNQESIHNKILTDSRSFVGVSISDSLCPDSEETLFSHYCRKSGGFLPLHDPHLSDLEDDFI